MRGLCPEGDNRETDMSTLLLKGRGGSYGLLNFLFKDSKRATGDGHFISLSGDRDERRTDLQGCAERKSVGNVRFSVRLAWRHQSLHLRVNE